MLRALYTLYFRVLLPFLKALLVIKKNSFSKKFTTIDVLSNDIIL